MTSSIRVLIVDDSALFREALSRELRKDPYILVAGTASDPFDARNKIMELNPDVMTLDVEMPKMDGIEFLRRLLPQHPIPVIVSSSIAVSVFDAIEAGAVDFVSKPSIGSGGMESYARELAAKIKMAVDAKVSVRRPAPRPAPRPPSRQAPAADSGMVIAIGASTGGTEAIFKVLSAMPAGMPGIVMVQHMPQGFTKLYAERLDKACALEVKEAENNDAVRPGRVLLAPGGDMHMKLVKGPQGYSVRLLEGEKVSGHRPSVDFLFDSVADAAGGKAVGVILTGMGADGAKGLLKMRGKGAYTIGQDEASCVVYGMPMAAYNMGAVARQLGLDQIPAEICGRLSIRMR
ncbi:MAG: chemotaxis response regulator protein-glutamate methylesterase [Clostridiales Family XIII bacterium]|jgi:two-component system chemotaxis response regulator CheB|nr:chemotaxis response regulator protein-glutamate methylesterase [Clostridiales Family XIII bacterium]